MQGVGLRDTPRAGEGSGAEELQGAGRGGGVEGRLSLFTRQAVPSEPSVALACLSITWPNKCTYKQ